MPTDTGLTPQVVADIEAMRHKMSEPELEEGLSLFDWVNGRIAPAVKQAAQMAKHADFSTQYEAWIEAAAMIVGRAEQVLLHQTQAECEHEFPSNGPRYAVDGRCDKCNLMLADFLARQERNELADELEAADKADGSDT